MQLRRLGESDLHISPVVLGAWAIGGWYWGGTDDKQAIAAIQASIDTGINALDTAPVYGFGHSEEVVGKAIKGRREQVLIMTKIGLRWDLAEGAHFFDVEPEHGGKQVFRNLRPTSIREEVENSLRRLQIDTIDLLQCHWPDPSSPLEATMHTLAQLIQEGKIRAAGVSNFSVQQLTLSKATLTQSSLPLASTQPRYSLLNRKIEKSIVPWLQREKVGSIVYSPIERGLLAGSIHPDRVFPSSDGRSFEPLFQRENRIRVLQALSEIKDLTEAYNCSFAQLAIAWCFHRPGVTAAIVGARNEKQALENAHAAHIELDKSDIQRLTQHFAAIQLVP